MKQHLLCLLLLAFASVASAQSTAFTYQGHLMDGGASANGNYDIQFTLKNALTAGDTVGTPQAVSPVAAVNGIFTVTLDFGSVSFDGSDRWVELGVRPAGSVAAYTVLAPRQRLTATPYALRALSSTSLTGTVTAGNIAAGTITGPMIAPGAAITTSTAAPAASLVNSTDNAAALSLSTPNRAWWLGQNRAPDATGVVDQFFIYDQQANATRLRIDLNGTIFGNGGGLTNLPASALTGTITSSQLASGLTLAGTTTGTFSGDGSGLTNIPASAIVPVTTPAPPAGMVLIPAGAFQMGNSVGTDVDIADSNCVLATISAFYMDQTEVTKTQWDAISAWAVTNGYTDLAVGIGKNTDHPVVDVSWHDVVKWCNARSEMEGKTPVYYTSNAQAVGDVYRTGTVNMTNEQVNWSANGYRLPTEAEWEKAARGGLSGLRFPWGSTISLSQANYVGNTSFATYDKGPNGNLAGGQTPLTVPVGYFAAGGYGLKAIAGNVQEWCWDRFGAVLAGGMDPHGTTSGADRMIRGGGWNSLARDLRCAFRNYGSPTSGRTDTGFRTIRAPGP